MTKAHPILPPTGDAGMGAAAAGPYYFVHSFRAMPDPANAPWVLATTDYAGDRFISAV